MQLYLLVCRLYRLRCCNKIVISLYKAVSKTDEKARNICIERSEKRQIAKKQLEKRIGKLRNQNCLWPENMLFYLVVQIFNTTSSIVLYFQPKNWNSIMYWESRNIQLYYTVLYTPGVPKPVVNMLLRQKNDIEEYMMNEGSM
ncbi:hypothetical protein [Christiangramia sp.]|uniref:hypothetical protein n=1 Tax=Christiangramia sp. TaxID=1931228 RepID=UPI00260816F4|nr:hypothetical protein [Christiangramia sp.]